MRVLPVTPARWDDMAALFTSTGAPHYCWCLPYRERKAHEMSKPQKRAAMRKRVKGGTPVGVLAYDGPEPVGWCSVAPRESYAKLERSRTMPRVDDRDTWTVLCFFVKRDHREQGVTFALLKGAVKYAKAKGAEVVEGYPWDTAGVSSTHRGHSSVFERAGFRKEGKRWVHDEGQGPGRGRGRNRSVPEPGTLPGLGPGPGPIRRSAPASRRPGDSRRAPSSRGSRRPRSPRSR